jgi:hypothetical protein
VSVRHATLGAFALACFAWPFSSTTSQPLFCYTTSTAHLLDPDNATVTYTHIEISNTLKSNLLIDTLAFALDISPPRTANMELEKYETQGMDGGVVDMRCLPEDGAEGASPARNLDGAGSASPEPGRTSRHDVEGAIEAKGKRDGEDDCANDDCANDDCANDEGGENGEIEDDQNTSEDTNSDTSSIDSWSDEAPPLNLNYEALKHVVDHFLPGSHGACIDITTIRRGGFHEIRVLHFEDGWSCIARFTREYEMLEKTESELATIEYVRKNTTIPVPEIYLVNHNENHVVGAAFVIMERMEGEQLRFVWHDLSLERKLGLVGELADIVGQLAEQKFDGIGSLKADGTLGPLYQQHYDYKPMSDQAFTSTIDWFFAFLDEDDPDRTEAVKKLIPEIKDELRSFFEKNANNPNLNAPYGLLHDDFQYQNMLVVRDDKTSAPRISAIIDWDYSQTAPLETIWEYPVLITDVDYHEEEYADNKVLRKHFVTSLMQRFPENSPERKQVKRCFREKCWTINIFYRILMRRWDHDCEEDMVKTYLRGVRGVDEDDCRAPYGGRWDWVMDSDLEDSDAESEVGEETSGDSETGSEDDSESDEESDDGPQGGSEVKGSSEGGSGQAANHME